jgi:hypothetical protein
MVAVASAEGAECGLVSLTKRAGVQFVHVAEHCFEKGQVVRIGSVCVAGDGLL